MGVFPSGQWGQTVNLLLFSFGGSNPPAPTKNSSVVKMLEFFFCPKLFKAYPRVDSNSCGAVAEDSAKAAQWAVFSSAACDIHPRPPNKKNPNLFPIGERFGFFVFFGYDSNPHF